MTQASSKPVVLTIAGLDPSGGAGIVADIKTIAAFGCFPAAALTSITFQNTEGVFGFEHQTAPTLRSQVKPIVADLKVSGAKTGMLPTAEIVLEVAQLFSEYGLPAPVVDPVIWSTSGYSLIDSDAIEAITTRLFRVARVVTPNIPEAERIAGLSIESTGDMRRAAEVIKRSGVSAVLVKGGHRLRDRNQALDVLLNEQGEFLELTEEFIDVGEVHGSGCTLSSAIASCLAKGQSLNEAVAEAKRYVTERIRAVADFGSVGRGARPL